MARLFYRSSSVRSIASPLLVAAPSHSLDPENLLFALCIIMLSRGYGFGSDLDPDVEFFHVSSGTYSAWLSRDSPLTLSAFFLIRMLWFIWSFFCTDLPHYAAGLAALL